MTTTTITDIKYVKNWESVRDLAGSFYYEATFEIGDNASYIYLLPEVPRVLRNYYHSGTIEGWQHVILNHIIWTCGSDPKKWFKMSADEFKRRFNHLNDGFETAFDIITFAIDSMIESDYYRAISYINSSVEDLTIASILKKSLSKSKTSKVKVDKNFWQIFG